MQAELDFAAETAVLSKENKRIILSDWHDTTNVDPLEILSKLQETGLKPHKVA